MGEAQVKEPTVLRSVGAVETTGPTDAEIMTFSSLWATAFGGGSQKVRAEVAIKCMLAREFGVPWKLAPSIMWFNATGSLSAHATSIRAAIRRSDKYDYEIVEQTETTCTIRIVAKATRKLLGEETYTIADAQKAALTDFPWWQKDPKSMLLARATSNAYKKWCPDVFGIPLYDYFELLETAKSPTAPKQHLVVEAPTPAQGRLDEDRRNYLTLRGAYYADAASRGMSLADAKALLHEKTKARPTSEAFLALEEAHAEVRKRPMPEAAVSFDNIGDEESGDPDPEDDAV
jgi:hypothetical protein